MKNILVIMPWLDEALKERLEASAPGCSFSYRSPAELTDADISGKDIVIGNIPAGMLHEPDIEFMQLTSAGADAYMPEGILKRSTVLSCCSGAYSQTVAEHGLAATLMLQKDLHIYRDCQAEAKWLPGGTTTSMADAVVLVMGLGEIGSYYARQAKALGAYVIGIRRAPSEKPDFVDELYTMESFDDVVGRADVIFSVLPSTPSTIHFYTKERFKKMKPGAIFLNCGRGTAVSCDVLYEVMSEGLIRSAAVDVFETEPLPADSPLWGLSNLLITPHASGFFHLPATQKRVTDICFSNLKAWLEDGVIRNVVDYSTGYRKR